MWHDNRIQNGLSDELENFSQYQFRTDNSGKCFEFIPPLLHNLRLKITRLHDGMGHGNILPVFLSASLFHFNFDLNTSSFSAAVCNLQHSSIQENSISVIIRCIRT